MQAERREEDAAAVDERPAAADERSTESDNRPTESVPSSSGAARAAPAMALPKDSEPVIVALRVVAREGERLTGAALRQALQGEGFVHGEMDIFHRALADGRVLMSAASLTKPGSFDLATMDSSRFLGINLFAVLPGPIAGRDAVDKLLSVGHTLAQRLRAQLLDSRGQPLTESRLAEMRREAAAAGGG
jgi:cell division protein ZipA